MNLSHKCIGKYSQECDVKKCEIAFKIKYLPNLVMVNQKTREDIRDRYDAECLKYFSECMEKKE